MTDEELRQIRSDAGRKGGAIGGKAKVKKGLASLSPERRQKIRDKALEARKGKK